LGCDTLAAVPDQALIGEVQNPWSKDSLLYNPAPIEYRGVTVKVELLVVIRVLRNTANEFIPARLVSTIPGPEAGNRSLRRYNGSSLEAASSSVVATCGADVQGAPGINSIHGHGFSSPVLLTCIILALENTKEVYPHVSETK
jgi:hypothetical protein